MQKFLDILVKICHYDPIYMKIELFDPDALKMLPWSRGRNMAAVTKLVTIWYGMGVALNEEYSFFFCRRDDNEWWYRDVQTWPSFDTAVVRRSRRVQTAATGAIAGIRAGVVYRLSCRVYTPESKKRASRKKKELSRAHGCETERKRKRVNVYRAHRKLFWRLRCASYALRWPGNTIICSSCSS